MKRVPVLRGRRTEMRDSCPPWPFISDMAIFVLKRDVKLQLTNYFGKLVFESDEQEFSVRWVKSKKISSHPGRELLKSVLMVRSAWVKVEWVEREEELSVICIKVVVSGKGCCAVRTLLLRNCHAAQSFCMLLSVCSVLFQNWWYVAQFFAFVVH